MGNVGRLVSLAVMLRIPSFSNMASGCSFVTGGLGAIGSLVGQWTAQHMTPDVRLAGRSGHYRLPLDVDKSKSAVLSVVTRDLRRSAAALCLGLFWMCHCLK